MFDNRDTKTSEYGSFSPKIVGKISGRATKKRTFFAASLNPGVKILGSRPDLKEKKSGSGSVKKLWSLYTVRTKYSAIKSSYYFFNSNKNQFFAIQQNSKMDILYHRKVRKVSIKKDPDLPNFESVTFTFFFT